MLKLSHNSKKSIIFAPYNVFRINYLTKNYKTMAYVITDSCVACGTCQPVCPVDAISEGDIYHIDPDTCIECGSCAEVCPSEAIIPGN